jgi:tRNA(fMet)-specific endonuclease VapC
LPRYLLDTSVIIELIKGDASIVARVVPGTEIYLPYVAIGELYFGAYRSSRVRQNTTQIVSLTLDNTLVFSGMETARQYGLIRADLAGKGRSIPDNDVWIAAIALEHNLVLVTRDAHFGNVENLSIERW